MIFICKEVYFQITITDTNNLYVWFQVTIYNLIIIISLHTVIWFQIFLSDMNHFQTDLKSTATLDQRGSRRNSNEVGISYPFCSSGWCGGHLFVPITTTAFSNLWQDESIFPFFVFFHFHSVVPWDSKIHEMTSLVFFLLIKTMSAFFFFFFFFFAKVERSIFISKSRKTSCVSFSRIDADLCIHHFLVWSNFNLLRNSQWITFTT